MAHNTKLNVKGGGINTLIACMSITGGPESCCGCIIGLSDDGIWEFFCNECERVVGSGGRMPDHNKLLWQAKRKEVKQ